MFSYHQWIIALQFPFSSIGSLTVDMTYIAQSLMATIHPKP